ncbi:MAG: SpoIID/LytB domain-containing protein [Eubacteriales bacterium]|nr:SpoIID/LytB domain-containing protein [Eubacteriales bacterium]
MLSNLGLEERIKIGVCGNYTIQGRLAFQRGTELEIRLTAQGIVLLYEGMSYYAGNELKLSRHRAEAGEENGLRLQEGLNLYTGDLRLSSQGGALQAVLTSPIEEYLMGVVPYEMSDDFPLEALKAQAIAARTYTLRNLKPGEPYDMTDTTNDQVYYGLNSVKVNAIKAVSDTTGIVLFYDNALAQCYYTASNGGFTESALNAWGRENIPYLGIAEDRYDLENPLSEVRQAAVPGVIGDHSQLNPSLLALLLDKLSPRLEALGCSSLPEDIRIDEVIDIVPHTTKFGGENGVMRYLRFDLKVSGKTAELPDSEVSFGAAAPDEAEAELSGFKTLPEKISVDCEIFPDIEAALNMSINRNPNELVRVEKADNGFRVLFTRYGHGVGMSQRGAEWMASTYGWDYQKILRFYYPGTQLSEADTSLTLPEPIGRDYLTTPGPVPTPTPRPTLMPIEPEKIQGRLIVRVTGIPVNSSLNLRAEASLSSEVIMRLFFGQELVVVEQYEDGWLLVETDVIKGYVRKEYVNFD